ncbi:hypothetical protein ACOACO_08675 [Nocardioides sp. CPCC 205120]|uniref:hypothetical protein n=1 Tax=Nocardioides sp. CPCC 205120 TaxID=3406462 RepID=UPI003B50E525
MTQPEQQPLPPVLAPPRVVAYGVGFLVVAVAAGVGAVRTDGGTRVALVVAALCMGAVAVLSAVVLVRVRRARQHPDSLEADRLRRAAAATAPPPSGQQRRRLWVLLGLSFALVLITGVGGLPDAVIVTVRLLQVAVGVTVIVVVVRQLVRDHRWRQEKWREG